MDEELGMDLLTIEDENGETFDLEVLGSFEVNNQEYMAALPADMEETDPDYGIILLRIEEEDGMEVYASIVEEEDGMEVYASIDDDDELDLVYESYMQILESEEED